METFVQIQESVFRSLNEVKDDNGFWTIEEVKDAINDTYLFIADRTLCFKLSAIIEIKSGIRTYKLPSDYIVGSLKRVEFDSKVIYPITSDELDAYSRSWRSTSGTPRYFLPPGDICNTDEIAFYPKPDTDGTVYNLASTSEDYGVVTTVGDDSYDEFNEEEGVIVATDGEAEFEELHGSGPVLDIQDPTGNAQIFGARYPKRLYNDIEVFLHPISHNPNRMLILGALAILFSRDGEGKDIAKASYYNKRFMESLNVLKGPNVKKMHRVRSITEVSFNNQGASGYLNLGEHYPAYYR